MDLLQSLQPAGRGASRIPLNCDFPLQAYKYVPFGEVEQVIPYLVRRAQENSSVLGGVEKEKKMVAAEVRHRLLRRPAKQEPALRSEANLGH